MSGLGWSGTRTRLRRRVPAWAAVLLALALLVLLAACEAPGVPHPLAAEAQGTATPATNGSPTPDDGAEPTDSDGSGGFIYEDRVEIEQSDFALTPDEFTVRAGEVTFAFVNTGRFTHDFRVEGQGIDEKAPKNGARRSREWSITLPPGTYRISCPISNHDERGMEGTMVVVE